MKKRLVCVLFGWLFLMPSFAQTTQQTPVGNPTAPPPNIMVNLDDSGSMTFDITPENLKPNGNEAANVTTLTGWCTYNCPYGSGQWIVSTFPRPNNIYNTVLMAGGNGWTDYPRNLAGTVYFNHNLAVARFRSPSVNLSYYDHNQTYLPWTNAQNGGRMAPANPLSTQYYPGSGFTINLTTTQRADIDPSGNQVFWLGDDGRGLVTYPSTTRFYPALYYRYEPAVTGCAANTKTSLACFTRVTISPATTNYPHNGGRSDCAASGCTYAQEIQNFANWFQYARSRVMASKSAFGTALSNVVAPANFGLWTINRNLLSTPISIQSQFSTVLNSFYNIPVPPQGTPSQAGVNNLGNWYASNSDTSSCRTNSIVFMTDGYWNDTASPVGNEDGSSGSTITNSVGDSYAYTPQAPYRDSVSGTLADVVMRWWKNDFKASIQNNVQPNSADPAFWQHIAFHGISLGVPSLLISNWTQSNPGVTNSQAESQILNSMVASNTPTWPNPWTNPDPTSKIDDLWHATINGRGQFFNSANVADLSNAFGTIFQTILGRVADGAAAAVSTPNITQHSNQIYSAVYTTSDWSGEVYQQTIDPNSGVISSSKTWSSKTTLSRNASSTAAVTPATLTTPSSDKRILYTAAPNSMNLIDFCVSGSGIGCSGPGGGMSASVMNLFSDPNNLSQVAGLTGLQRSKVNRASVVDWLRGRNTYESGNNPVAVNKLYRVRTELLGDIVNASPVYVGQPSLEYETGTSSPSGYAAYKTTTRAPALFVASNDGFLHAFNPTTGKEMWGYAPPPVLPLLPNLADTQYVSASKHLNLIDSTPVVGDVYDPNSSTWKSILVGGFGSGIKGYYAVDVSNPSEPKPLWNFCTNSQLCNVTDGDVGNALGKPLLTQVKWGQGHKWVVIVPSGYDNTGTTSLFILDALSGNVLKKVSMAGINGTAKISAWAENWRVDNVSLAVYGGDLTGNVWRVNLLDASNPVFEVLATLKDANGLPQPITAAIEFNKINGHRVLYVGTGRLLKDSDGSNSQTQTVYALKDKVYTATPRATTTFVQQRLTQSSTVTRNIVQPQQMVDWDVKDGWYVDFLNGGERVAVDMSINGSTLSVATSTPNSDPCLGGGVAWLYNFDFSSGGKPPTMSVTTSVGNYLGRALATKPIVIKLPNGTLIAIVRLTDNTVTTSTLPSSASVSGRRVGWRMLMN